MNNEIYRKNVLPANESHDGESPEFVTVTTEANGFAVWVGGCRPSMHQFIPLFGAYAREDALECAVWLAFGRLEAREVAKAKEAGNE